MSRNKSIEKDATGENNCDINDKNNKYGLFPAIAKAYKSPDEGKRAFMERIGMGKQGSMFSDFMSGKRNVTDLSFDKIRMSLRWSVEETAKFERLLEKDHEILKQNIKSKPKKSKKQQDVAYTAKHSDSPDVTPKTAEPTETKCHVRAISYEDMKEHANLVTPVGRLLTFGHLVINNSLRQFAVPVGLTEEWLTKAIREQSTDYKWLEKFMDELDGYLDTGDDLSQWIMRGKSKKTMDCLVAEYRGAIPDPHPERKDMSKENGSSGL